MQSNSPMISNTDILAVRDFLMGATDEVRISSPQASRPRRPSQSSHSNVPVSNGISRARSRSAKAGV